MQIIYRSQLCLVVLKYMKLLESTVSDRVALYIADGALHQQHCPQWTLLRICFLFGLAVPQWDPRYTTVHLGSNELGKEWMHFGHINFYTKAIMFSWYTLLKRQASFEQNQGLGCSNLWTSTVLVDMRHKHDCGKEYTHFDHSCIFPLVQLWRFCNMCNTCLTSWQSG